MVNYSEKISIDKISDIAPYVIASLCQEINKEENNSIPRLIDDNRVLYELTISLLGSLSKHEHTVYFSGLIRDEIISTGEYKLLNELELNQRIFNLLSPSDGGLKCRFSKVRSQHIACAFHNIVSNYGSAMEMIKSHDCELSLRAFLVKN